MKLTEIQRLEKSIESLQKKNERLSARQMQRYRDGTASRALTTTYNARAGTNAEEINRLKKKLSILNGES